MIKTRNAGKSTPLRSSDPMPDLDVLEIQLGVASSGPGAVVLVCRSYVATRTHKVSLTL